MYLALLRQLALISASLEQDTAGTSLPSSSLQDLDFHGNISHSGISKGLFSVGDQRLQHLPSRKIVPAFS